MATISSAEVLNAEQLSRVSYLEQRWYAVYTVANHEKRVAKHLRERSINNLLPLYQYERRWKDRLVEMHTPLFPGYVFVHIALHDRLPILQTPGIVHLVSFGGQPVPLAEDEILAIQNCLNHGFKVEPHPYLRVGHRVQIKRGPLCGLEGAIIRRKNRLRFVLSLDLLQRAVAIELDARDLQPVN